MSDRRPFEDKSIPTYAAMQLDALEALCGKWRAAIGQRGTEPLKAHTGQYRDWIASQPALFTDLSRQRDPTLNERHAKLITQANELLTLSALTLARKGEPGYLMGAAFSE